MSSLHAWPVVGINTEHQLLAESYFWPDQNLSSLWILHEETSKFEKCKPMYLSTEKKSTNLKIKSGFDIAM